jgi:hypothetical protein
MLNAPLRIKHTSTHRLCRNASAILTELTMTYGRMSGYKCNLKHSMELGADGSVEPKIRMLQDAYRNMELVIDRKSGRMAGGFGIGGEPIRGQQVWRQAESGSGTFKAVYAGPGYNYVLWLHIDEYRRGAVKPFLLIESGTDIVNIHSGTCTHLG